MLRLAGNVLSPAGKRARLSILGYHRALRAPDPLDYQPDAATFERHMSFLGTHFNVLRLTEACERLARGALPARAACVTFDDGYADNEEVALPILKRLGLPATFFVSTGYLHGAVMFNDGVIEAVRKAAAGTYELSGLGLRDCHLGDSASRRAAAQSIIGELKYRPVGERNSLVERLASILRIPLPKNLMMNEAQIRRLHQEGMEIGAHTVRHPILACVDDHEARAEISESKHTLEELTGSAVSLFAYPNGKPGRDYTIRHANFVREAGFLAAVSTGDGVARLGSDLFQLPRLGAWERNPLRLGLRILATCARPVASARPAHLPMDKDGQSKGAR